MKKYINILLIAIFIISLGRSTGVVSMCPRCYKVVVSFSDGVGGFVWTGGHGGTMCHCDHCGASWMVEYK